MLESLLKVMPADALVPVLRGDLERIELALDGRQPPGTTRRTSLTALGVSGDDF